MIAGTVSDRPRLHYIDECRNRGSERGTVLCLHGEIAWSLAYRDVIPGLVNAGYRVIAPDLIGFGKSDKFVDVENYTHEMHTASIKQLIVELGIDELNNLTLVAHGSGGIVGLSVLKAGTFSIYAFFTLV